MNPKLAEAGGIPFERKQEAGREAISLARKALEIDTEVHGLESARVSNDMTTLAQVLTYFNGIDDEEVTRLYEQSIVVYTCVYGRSSVNVATNEGNLGLLYHKR